MAGLCLDELVAGFRACTLWREQWTHEAHLKVGAWHVHHHGAEVALEMLRSGIRRLNDHHGKVNSTTSGYHETITVAYVRLIEAFLATFATRTDEATLEARVATLIAGPLGQKAVLSRFWTHDLLMSPRARAQWLPPDLAPLEGFGAP